MAALIGRYEYTLDPKHRIFVPPRFREEFAAEHGRNLFLAIGSDPCVQLFLPSQWEKVVANSDQYFNAKDKRQTRALKRILFSKAIAAELDEQGRILIPQHQLDHGRLRKEVVVLGAGDKAELWDKALLAANEKATQKLFQKLSSSLDI